MKVTSKGFDPKIKEFYAEFGAVIGVGKKSPQKATEPTAPEPTASDLQGMGHPDVMKSMQDKMGAILRPSGSATKQ